MTTLVIIAKEPLPGRAKTRLHPPLSLDEAADVAAAALADTVELVAGVPATRRVLFYAGDRRPIGSEHFDVIPQPDGGLDERLAALFDQLDGPSLLIGMDTPQLNAAALAPALDWPSDVDAFFGPAADGGFWALGMREPRGDVIRGVPMSQPDTGAVQRERLAGAGLRVADLPEATDVDTWSAALEVAALAPHGRFGRTVAGLSERVG